MFGNRIRIINKYRFIFSMSIIALLLISILMLSFNTVSGDNIMHYDNYFVENGDTLWEIAKELTGEEMDVRIAINSIIELNEIESSDNIYPGQKLILPRYN